MAFKAGDVIDTTNGLLVVQCPLTFKDNNHPKYNKLGSRTLYWLQNMEMEDVFFWDTELQSILTENEVLANDETEEF